MSNRHEECLMVFKQMRRWFYWKAVLIFFHYKIHSVLIVWLFSSISWLLAVLKYLFLKSYIPTTYIFVEIERLWKATSVSTVSAFAIYHFYTPSSKTLLMPSKTTRGVVLKIKNKEKSLRLFWCLYCQLWTDFTHIFLMFP